MNTLYYTGVGSRQTPPHILELMTKIARHLSEKGYILRSGHAEGADRAFEKGAGGKAIIYLPWPSFGQKPYKDDPGMPVLGTPVCNEAIWDNYYSILQTLGTRGDAYGAVKKLHGRNVAQVLGHDPQKPEPSKILFYWAPKDSQGNPTGGTRTAVALAIYYNIPTIDLSNEALLRKTLPSLYT